MQKNTYKKNTQQIMSSLLTKIYLSIFFSFFLFKICGCYFMFCFFFFGDDGKNEIKNELRLQINKEKLFS